jgi:signal transduction histidine kinase
MRSLQRQLQISLAIVLALILFILLLITNLSSRNLLETFVNSRLQHDAKNILDSLASKPNNLKLRWRRLNPIYHTPYSGHYYAIRFNNKQNNFKIMRSPSLKNHSLPTPDMEKTTVLHNISGPKGQHLVVWSQKFNKQGQEVIISVAEDMTLLKRNRRQFSLLFIIMGLIGFAFMLLLQHFVIQRLFKHLQRSREEIRQMEAGKLQQLSENVPAEIYPLVKEFNHSLLLMQQRMQRSRNALGNLAHALKTPLSLLMQQLDNGIADANKHQQQSLQQAKNQAERIRQLMERELKRARMAGLGNTTQRFDPKEELPVLIKVIKQAHHKNNLDVSLCIADSVTQFGDREDMLELLGNLIDNACKWAKSQVICSISLQNKSSDICIIIEDNGVTKADQELEQLTKRGIRFDENIEGYGLGLAICKDIIKLYAGTIYLGQSKNLGGFRVEASLPIVL